MHFFLKKLIKIKKLKYFSSIFVMFILIIFFANTSDRFLSFANIINMLKQLALPLIVAIAITFVVIIGSIDLSVDGMMALSAVVVSLLITNTKTNYSFGIFGIIIALLSTTFFGFINGIIQVKGKIPSFMCSFGMLNITLGLAFLLYKGNPAKILDVGFRNIALGTLMGVPISALIALIVFFISFFIEKNTKFGRYIFAIGEDETILKKSGVNVDKYKILAFTFSGFLLGLAGLISVAKLGQGFVNAGTGHLFPAIIAVVLGGTTFSGGTGGILNTLLGTLTVTILNNGLVILKVNPYYRYAIEGIIVILAVSFTIKRSQRTISK